MNGNYVVELNGDLFKVRGASTSLPLAPRGTSALQERRQEPESARGEQVVGHSAKEGQR